jgi:hypothetical protein
VTNWDYSQTETQRFSGPARLSVSPVTRMQRMAMVKFLYLFLAAQAPLLGQTLQIGDAPSAPLTLPKPTAQGRNVAARATTSNWYDTSNRTAIRDSWHLVMAPTLTVPMGWSGDVAAGIAGDTSQNWKDAVNTRINWFRAMAGVPAGIVLDPTYSAKAQQAAMMFSVNQQIDHFPPTTWINYTVDGAEAARNSNICYLFGFFDPGCVQVYIVDLGLNNSEVGHRRWLLYPQTQRMGTGDVSQVGSYPYTNALWVFDGNFGAARPATRTPYVAWPPPGYVPYQVAGPRWSFSYPLADFSQATVSVMRNGATVPVRIEAVQDGYGENTLVWVPDNLDVTNFAWQGTAPAADVTSVVIISGVSIGGISQSFSYSVTVFDPNSQPTSTFNLTPASATTPYTGGTGSTSLTVTPAGTTWSAVSSATWLGITSGASGTGNGTISWSAPATASILTRTATITVGSASYVLTQPGIPCSYSLSQASATLPVAGGSGSFVVTVTPSDCGLYYTNSIGLAVTVVSSTPPVFNFHYSAGANTTKVTRTLTVAIANQTFTILQAGTTPLAAKVGVFRSGFFWLLDVDGDRQFNVASDKAFAFGGIAGDIPITGDWDGSGKTKVGVYRASNGLFLLDYDGNGIFDPAVDKIYSLGVGTQTGDIPVVGDWNGSGTSKVGLFRQGFFWILDTNGNGTFDTGDQSFAYGGVAGDVPVVGDWNGTGTSKVGIFRAGFLWILDTNGNHVVDAADQVFPFGGISGDVPVVGDWNGTGASKVGVFRAGFFWVLDTNGNQGFDGGTDQAFAFGGITGDRPIVGKW